jgi:hypothetical protein
VTDIGDRDMPQGQTTETDNRDRQRQATGTSNRHRRQGGKRAWQQGQANCDRRQRRGNRNIQQGQTTRTVDRDRQQGQAKRKGNGDRQQGHTTKTDTRDRQHEKATGTDCLRPNNRQQVQAVLTGKKTGDRASIMERPQGQKKGNQGLTSGDRDRSQG